MLPRLIRLSCIAMVVSFPATAHSQQTMREVLNELFFFAGGDDPLFLVGTAGQPATAVHGEHFIPASSEANSAVLQFFTNTIASNIANFPLGSTVASKTVKFVNGVPVATSHSFGPIFAERAQTIGRGRLNAGLNYSRLRFSEIRGIALNNVRLNFVHENTNFPNCDVFFGGDCALYGVPQFENDLIGLSLELDIDADVFAFFGTFGVTDWMDLSFAIPVISASMKGTSVATVIPSIDPTSHFFSGTQDEPGLQATTQAFGDASGIGDVAGRLKVRIVSGDNWDFGLIAEGRAPTGDEENFLGTGEWSFGGLLIISGTFSDFSPHSNVGYQRRTGEFDQDIFKLIAGFDQRLADWATLAVDFLGAFQVGEQNLTFPEPVEYEAPFVRSVEVTNIPNSQDDILDGSFGFKFQVPGGLIIVTNVLVPLNSGGLRANWIPTLGIEYTL